MNKKVISIVAIIAIVAILGVVLVACNASSYEKKLEKAGYEVQVMEADEEDKEEGIEWMVTGEKLDGLKPVMVMVVKFAKTDRAKEAEEDAIKFYGEDCVSRSGKIVIAASSKEALKDAK